MQTILYPHQATSDRQSCESCCAAADCSNLELLFHCMTGRQYGVSRNGYG